MKADEGVKIARSELGYFRIIADLDQDELSASICVHLRFNNSTNYFTRRTAGA